MVVALPRLSSPIAIHCFHCKPRKLRVSLRALTLQYPRMPITDTRIRNCKVRNTPNKLADGRGLYIEIRPTGTKLWRYRYRIGGKENVYALGEYALAPRNETAAEARDRISGGRLTLLEARTERDKARALVKQGIHPSHRRAEAKAAQIAANADTFEAVAGRWLAEKRKIWTPRSVASAEAALRAGLFPSVGSLPVRSITPGRILELLRQSERRSGPAAAIKLRQLASQVFHFAIVNQLSDSDPATLLKGAITHRTRHHKAIPRDRIKALFDAMDAYMGNRETKIAMTLLLLLFTRTGELRGAEWSEFDLDACEWRIQANRMKMRQQHIVPLAPQAIALLRELHARTGMGRYLFPNTNRRDTYMSASTLYNALTRMGFKGEFSAHGFRATASTSLNEMGYPPDVIERQLAHKPRDSVRASYNRAEYLEERRQMMQQWADVLDGLAKGDKKVLTGRFSRAA